ncbi:MAG: hypothetical protein JW828_02285 [Sedimentisphaerales bacterium]|nr:hypothetical protein [Sedimentisphaerales bacterium]
MTRSGWIKAFIVLCDQVFRSGTMLATGIIVARTCTVSDHGLFVVGYAAILLAGSFQETIIATPLYVFLHGKSEQQRPAYQCSVILMQTMIALLAAVAIGIIGLLGHIRQSQTASIFLLAAPTTFAVISRDYIRQHAFASLHPGQALVVDVMFAFLQLGLLTILVCLKALTGSRALLIMGLAALAVCIIPYLILLRPDRSFDGNVFKTTVRDHFAFGQWRILAYIVIWIGLQSYPFYLVRLAGREEASYYGASLRIALVFSPIMAGLINFVLPWLSQRNSTHGTSAYRRTVIRLSFVVLSLLSLVVLTVWLFGAILLEWLYGARYAHTNTVLRLLVIAAAVHNSAFCVGLGFLAERRPWLEVQGYSLALVVSLPIGLYGCIHYGAQGAAWGYLVCTVTVTVFRWWIFLRQAPAAEAMVNPS